MKVETVAVRLDTGGHGEVHDMTANVAEAVGRTGIQDGLVTVFCPSATSAVTTLEYEHGCIQDLQRLFDEIIPPQRDYAHNARWGDGNGHSHVRAALLGPSLTVPLAHGRLLLGTWQQIVLVDFDNRPRRREVLVHIMGHPAGAE